MNAEIFLQICGGAVVGALSLLLISWAFFRSWYWWACNTAPLIKWLYENHGTDDARRWKIWKKRRDERLKRIKEKEIQFFKKLDDESSES